MGFKKQNYKTNGINLIEAYAILEKVDIVKVPAVATFKIHSSRDNALRMEPLERKFVTFNWNRKDNPIEAAYEAAKTRTIEHVNLQTDETFVETVKGVFDGWEDDVEGNNYDWH